MSPDEGKRIILRIAEVIEVMFAADGGIHAPIFHFKGDHGETVIVSPSTAGSSHEKDQASMIMRQILDADNAVWVVVITEAWVVSGREEEIGRIDRAKGLADHPMRREVVMYQMEDEDFGMMDGMQTIVRPDGASPHLAKMEWHHSREGSGRLVGLLPRKKLSS
jgi:hypothetical protein